MIEELKVKNVALLRNVNLHFEKGFNVLLGETGAGKSIILDALNFVLGAKADKGLITHGEENLKVEAVFSDYSNEVSQELVELGFEDEGVLIISRTLNLQGKSEVRINGSVATLNMLKSLTRFLVDSYSQHENLMLLKPKNHLDILDNYSPEILEEEKLALASLSLNLKELNSKIETVGGSSENRERLLSLLKFQIDEIAQLNPNESEEQQLSEALVKMSNAEKIATNLSDAYANLNGGQFSTLTNLKAAIRNILQISSYSPDYATLAERLESSMFEIEDIASTLNSEQDYITFNQSEFDRLDAKLDRYKSVKKKYGATVQEVLKFFEKIKGEYEALLNAEEILAKCEKEKTQLLEKANKVCASLTQKRKALALELEKKVKAELKDLGMKNVEFIVSFSLKDNFDANGIDEIEFLFSANAGVEVKPLSKIISGGEMSRFSLALKNIIKGQKACLVFDEIDSGISGEIGTAVAGRIGAISKHNQVICISHSAQVCAMADKFFFVKKTVENNLTSTTVKPLEETDIISALAKMSGGNNVGEVSLTFAKELLENSRLLKQAF